MHKVYFNNYSAIALSFLIATLSLIEPCYGQIYKSIGIQGTVKDDRGDLLSNVMVEIKNLGLTTFSDQSGKYLLESTIEGEYEIIFSLKGYETITRSMKLNDKRDVQLDIQLVQKAHTLKEVTVTGLSETAQIKLQAYNVSSIDANKLHNTTSDLNQALNKVSGVRVRENGGLGSSFNFSLNGFTGSQVKFFLDGIPMDNFGTSLQMNNIPINIADHIEVYKGVVPVKLGADALGGAINIVTNSNRRNYLDVSYSYGSFNTHKTSINAGYTTKSGFTFQLNALQNYSDNNYKVDVEVANLVTGLYEPKTVRRFHDRYRNETVMANVGLAGKKYADKLLLGITLGHNDAQIQTGNRMFDVYGGRSRNGTIVMPTLKYLKNDLFTERLNFALNANYNFGYEQTVDTLNRQYNWEGEYRDKSNDPLAPGGELSRTLYKFRNNNATVNGKFDYTLNNKHGFTLSNTFTSFNRKGSDQLNLGSELNKQPRENYKNILGAAYQFSPVDAFNLTVFYKNYNQATVSFSEYHDGDLPIGPPTEFNKVKKHFNKSGFGTAVSYFLHKSIQLKTSYERTYRLPDNNEIFGNPTVDLINNFSLTPEKSDNINLGVSYHLSPGMNHRIGVESNFIYRNAKDFIRPSLISNGGIIMAKMQNQQHVKTAGIDGTVNYLYKDVFNLSLNVTYQNIRNNTKYEPGASEISDVYNDRIPNLPYLFGNVDAQYTFKNLLKKGNVLNIGYHLNYVHEYFLNWPSHGQLNTKPIIPGQLQHNISTLYTLSDGRYNIGLECRNLLDAKIYDNYSLQKPGRSFSVKIRYFLCGVYKH